MDGASQPSIEVRETRAEVRDPEDLAISPELRHDLEAVVTPLALLLVVGAFFWNVSHRPVFRAAYDLAFARGAEEGKALAPVGRRLLRRKHRAAQPLAPASVDASTALAVPAVVAEPATGVKEAA